MVGVHAYASRSVVPWRSAARGRAEQPPGLLSADGVLALQRTAGNAAVARLVQRAPLKDTYTVELTGDMVTNHVADSEESARAKTKARFHSDKDVDWNTVVKGTSASVARAVGNTDDSDGQNGGGDRFYQPLQASIWQYYAGLKGAEGTKVDPADEKAKTVWLKCYEKVTPGGAKFVKVTGIDSVV